MVNCMHKVKILFKITLFTFIILFVGLIGIYIYAYFTPSIELNTANSYYFYDNKDNVISYGSSDSKWVKLNEIDQDFIKYIINTEDKYFYYHKGFDILRIMKTMLDNIKNKKIVAGASSISQQYVKNLFLTFDQTWERKIEEAFLTIRLETHYSKDDIIEGYLNTIYFGQDIYGIKDASLYYFNKDIKDITMEEAIILAGIPKSPNNYNPISNMEACKKRCLSIASNLLKNKIISQDEYNSLDFDNIELYGKKEENNSDTLMYYKDAVIDELNSIDGIPKSLIDTKSLRIYTNLDMDTQLKMEESIKKNNNQDETQIAAIVTDVKTGKIVALSGGVNYAKSQYNRVTKSKRQVGSTIKPFLYYGAIKNGMTSASTFKSEETTFVFAEDKLYSPTNYGDKYANKNITMNAALAYSDNIYAVKTHLFLGENVLVDTLEKAGLKEHLDENPSLALGAKELNMLDYATSYTTLANMGIKNELYLINRIEDINGNILYQHKDESEQVLDSSISFIISEMMCNTYNYDYIDYYNPTILYLNGKMSRKYAIKSGTTDNDYWISGFNNDVLTMVWAGNDDNKSVNKNYSKYIKDIWLDTIEEYEKDKDKESTWYTIPDNVNAVPMNPISGKYDKNAKTLFYFLSGSELSYIDKKKD